MVRSNQESSEVRRARPPALDNHDQLLLAKLLQESMSEGQASSSAIISNMNEMKLRLTVTAELGPLPHSEGLAKIPNKKEVKRNMESELEPLPIAGEVSNYDFDHCIEQVIQQLF